MVAVAPHRLLQEGSSSFLDPVMPYVDQATAFVSPYYAAYVAPYVPATWCAATAALDTYIATVTSTVSGVEYTKLHESVISGTVASATLLIVGGCLFLAPVIFGRNWLAYVEVLVGLVGGIVGADLLLDKYATAYVDMGADMVGLTGDYKCAAVLGLILLSALIFTYLVQKVKALAFFVLGAAGAGFGAFVVSDLAKSVVETQFAVTVTDMMLYAAMGACALIGGTIFGCCAESLLDLALGVLGGILVAQGGISIALVDFITAEQAAALKVDQYYMYYVGGTALVLFLLRCFLVSAREGDGKKAELVTSSPSSTKGAPKGRGGPQKKIAPAPSPAQKKMQSKSKAMY